MPILGVEIVLPPGEHAPRGLASAIADAAGEVFRTPRGGTWVRLRELTDDGYAENGAGPDPGLHPVFVHVLKAVLPPEDVMREEAAALATAVARACNRKAENVHVLYEPPAAGRIAFGGKLSKRDAGSQGER